MIHGRACYRTFKITGARADRVLIEDSDTLFVGRNMVKLLSRCDHATLLSSTIGAELEKKVDHIKKSHTADAYFLDAVGGWMADYMTDRVDGASCRTRSCAADTPARCATAPATATGI